MFHKEFYPTPENVLDLLGCDFKDKIVYEPHAGKGDIVDYALKNGATKVIASELNDDLRKIVESKCQVIGSDVFDIQKDDISHVDLIVANPPFSNAKDHIKHLWRIAPEGCQLHILFNYDNITTHHNGFNRVKHLIKTYGCVVNLGNVFSDAERKTEVNTGYIVLNKPITSKGHTFDFKDYLEDDDETYTAEGLIAYDEVRATVQRYIDACNSFDAMQESIDRINSMLSPIARNLTLNMNFGHSGGAIRKEDYLRKIQFEAWKHIFSKMKVEKYLTSSIISGLKASIEKHKNTPFTVRNVKANIMSIVQQRDKLMEQALDEALGHFTKYTHENRFELEGWKTNSGHMLNKKFIVNGAVSFDFNGKLRCDYGTRTDSMLADLLKVLCWCTGKNFDDMQTFYSFSRDGLDRGKWLDWGFFEVKVFNKGTAHFKFKDDTDWYLLNKKYGEIKGFVLPENL